MCRALSLLCALALLVAAAQARGEERDPAQARALFASAKADAKAEDYRAAVAKFSKSYRLDPKPGTLRNVAFCEEQLGRLASALRHYREVAEKFPTAAEHVNFASERVAELEKRVPRLTIKFADGVPAGTKVVLDGQEVTIDDVGKSLAVDPGEHEIEVTAPGREGARFVVKLEDGGAKTLDVAPGSPEAAKRNGAETGAVTRHQSTVSSGHSSWRTIGIASAAGGAVLFGIGVLVLRSAASSKSDSVDDHCLGPGRTNCSATAQDDFDAAKNLRTATYIAYGVGGASLVAGLTLWLLAPSQPQSGGVRFQPAVGPSTAAVRMTAAW